MSIAPIFCVLFTIFGAQTTASQSFTASPQAVIIGDPWGNRTLGGHSLTWFKQEYQQSNIVVLPYYRLDVDAIRRAPDQTVPGNTTLTIDLLVNPEVGKELLMRHLRQIARSERDPEKAARYDRLEIANITTPGILQLKVEDITTGVTNRFLPIERNDVGVRSQRIALSISIPDAEAASVEQELRADANSDFHHRRRQFLITHLIDAKVPAGVRFAEVTFEAMRRTSAFAEIAGPGVAAGDIRNAPFVTRKQKVLLRDRILEDIKSRVVREGVVPDSDEEEFRRRVGSFLEAGTRARPKSSVKSRPFLQ